MHTTQTAVYDIKTVGLIENNSKTVLNNTKAQSHIAHFTVTACCTLPAWDHTEAGQTSLLYEAWWSDPHGCKYAQLNRCGRAECAEQKTLSNNHCKQANCLLSFTRHHGVPTSVPSSISCTYARYELITLVIGTAAFSADGRGLRYEAKSEVLGMTLPHVNHQSCKF